MIQPPFAQNEMRNTFVSTVRFPAKCVLSLAFVAGWAAIGQEYWVSTTGAAAAAGTKENPFATLERTRDAMREAKKAGPLKAAVNVWLGGGVYGLEKTLALEQ